MARVRRRLTCPRRSCPRRTAADVDIPAGGMARIYLALGVVVSGLVAFDVDAAAGTLLDLSFTEVALALPVSMDKSRAGTRYITRGHHNRFQTFDSNGFRYAYVLVSGAVGTVTLRHFAVQEELYPWQAGSLRAATPS